MANEKATFCGLLNSWIGTEGKVRSFRAREVVGGNQSRPEVENREHFEGTGRRSLSLLFWERRATPWPPLPPGLRLAAPPRRLHSATCWMLSSIPGAQSKRAWRLLSAKSLLILGPEPSKPFLSTVNKLVTVRKKCDCFSPRVGVTFLPQSHPGIRKKC